MLSKTTLASDMIRAFTRTVVKENTLGATGFFESGGKNFNWGAVSEYGAPPVGGFLVEITHPDGHCAEFRIWYAVGRDDEPLRRGRVVMYDDIPEDAECRKYPASVQKR